MKPCFNTWARTLAIYLLARLYLRVAVWAFAQQQRTTEADDDDEWIWPDSDDEDEERCIATLKALHRMDFSVMDAHRDEEQHRKQHDSCSTAQAQAP